MSDNPTIELPDVEVTAPRLLSDDPDEVSIRVKGVDFKGWESVTITRSCEAIPNAFSLTASSEYLQGEALTGTRPEQECEIYIGNDIVITGWIDRRSISIDANNDRVTISGRGKTRNLVDCSTAFWVDPDLQGGQLRATDMVDLATQVSKYYKVAVRAAVEGDRGPPIVAIQVSLNETPYQIIESCARYTAFLVYEDAKGMLVLDRVGKVPMASGFNMPGNIEVINAERSTDGRYSEYYVVWNPVNNYIQVNEKANQRAYAKDDEIKAIENRLKVMAMSAVVPADVMPDFGQRMADWERNRRYGRSQAAMITCDSWRDEKGELWQPNRLARIEAPRADIVGADWIIGTVTYRKDLSGTHTDLVLMPPLAFSPEPSPLNLFPQQLAHPQDGSANPITGNTTAPP